MAGENRSSQMLYNRAMFRDMPNSKGLKAIGAWACLLVLCWALAGSWFGHIHVPHCEGGACHALAEDAGETSLIAPEAGERHACLACHLLRCLQTASSLAAPTAPASAAHEALPPEAFLTASMAVCLEGSARSPPLV